MFGISDPGIWLAYLLALVCLFYSIWFGITPVSYTHLTLPTILRV